MESPNKSTLVISADINTLQTYAKETSAKFNPADIFWLTAAEPNASIQVKETVEFMEKAHLSPVGDRKLMIICDISAMTTQAQNKILKTVEDAPAATSFLLLGTNSESVLNTVKSRCVTRYLPQKSDGKLIPEETAKLLRSAFGVDIDEKTLNTQQRHVILETVSKINRAVAFNCNAVNQQDLLVMELLKCVKQ